jgi:hypothetical protein
MIIIADRMDGHHARVVQGHLEQRGARVFIADVSELGVGAELSFCPQAPERTEWRRRDGTVMRMSEAEAIWFRPGDAPDIPLEVSDRGDRRFCAREWRELVRGAFTSCDVPMVNPFHAMLNATKPYQLTMACRAGLAVPDTLITSSTRRVLEFVAGPGEVVHKTITGTDDRLLATKLWDDGDAQSLHELELAPTIFQRRVDGTRELRITVVGERVFAAEFSTALTDGRLDRAVSYKRHELPTHVARGLLTLLERLSLPFATVDMRIDARGEYQFLEVNPAGVFLGIEIRTGMPIAAAVADLLYDAATRRHSLPSQRSWWRSDSKEVLIDRGRGARQGNEVEP